MTILAEVIDYCLFSPLQWSKCIATSRYGIDVSKDPAVWTHGIQNWQEINIALEAPKWYKGALGSLSEAVYRLFTDNYARSWQTFASTSHAGQAMPGSEWLSLEYIHNNVHVSLAVRFGRYLLITFVLYRTGREVLILRHAARWGAFPLLRLILSSGCITGQAFSA